MQNTIQVREKEWAQLITQTAQGDQFRTSHHRAEAGTEHHDTSSDTGCLLLIISSPQNEMLG